MGGIGETPSDAFEAFETRRNQPISAGRLRHGAAPPDRKPHMRNATPADDPIGPDIERGAIQAEETAAMMPAEAHSARVGGLLRAASPLFAGVPGARPCRSCGRGVWVSPSSPGPHAPDLCAACRWAGDGP